MKPTVLIIIGITGDLSKRKLLPAIQELIKLKAVPETFKVVGVTRREYSTQELLNGVNGDVDLLDPKLEVYQMDLTSLDDYIKLKAYLTDLDKTFEQPAQKLFYLSIPPQISLPVVELLGKAGIADSLETKLLMEKPFGTDYESAEDLVTHATQYFNEEQIYRIDHYLAKEMAQNLVVFRQNNSLFRRTWNKNFIENIEIIASEKIGIEGRGAFYEQTGALRDIVQSHLLQLAALTLANLQEDDTIAMPQKRLNALRHIITPSNIAEQAIRGQYIGYRDEAENSNSMVETYVSLKLYSDDPQWDGVPITLITGKALDRKATEIRITYRQDTAEEANVLTLRIQPNEGVEIDLLAKKPGYEHALQVVPLSFSYQHHFSSLPEAYERVFIDAIRSDRSLFTTSEEVLETWRILKPVQQAWEMGNTNLHLYKAGSTPDSIKTV